MDEDGKSQPSAEEVTLAKGIRVLAGDLGQMMPVLEEAERRAAAATATFSLFAQSIERASQARQEDAAPRGTEG